MPDAEAFEEAEREVVALGGCLLPEQPAAFVCRSCGLEWGSESDPTVGEAELLAPLDVGFSDLVRALGTRWRREAFAGARGNVRRFVSGEPAQLAVGAFGPWLVLDRPLTDCGQSAGW